MGSVETELQSRGVYGLRGWLLALSPSSDAGEGRLGTALSVQKASWDRELRKAGYTSINVFDLITKIFQAMGSWG